MKFLITLAATVAVFFLTSCSDVTQDLSPVSSSSIFDKQNSPIDEFYPYSYLQQFTQVEVKNFSSPEAGGILVELGDIKSITSLRHVYAVLDYSSDADPSSDEIVYLGSDQKPNLIEIPNHSAAGLKEIRVYTLSNFDGVINGEFNYLKEFVRLNIAGYSIANGFAKVNLQNWDQSMSHTFAEIHYKYGSTLVYLQRLTSNKFSMPINNSKNCLGLDVYSVVF